MFEGEKNNLRVLPFVLYSFLYAFQYTFFLSICQK